MKATEFVTFTLEGVVYTVPAWAPFRIVALAAMKPGARIVSARPIGSAIWHPDL